MSTVACAAVLVVGGGPAPAVGATAATAQAGDATLDPAATAAAWSAATDDATRRRVLLEVLTGIGIGVYTADGTPVLPGEERTAADPWLLDGEVDLLAQDPAGRLWVSLADRAVTLRRLIRDASGDPVGSEDLVSALEAGMAAALADPDDPAGGALRLARELVFRESGVDLAGGVPADLPMGSLAATLVAWDLLWPTAVGPARVKAAAFGLAAVRPGRADTTRTTRGGPAGREATPGAATTTDRSTAQACDAIGGGGGEWRLGASGRQAGLRSATGARAAAVLHAIAMTYAIDVVAEDADAVSHIHHEHPNESGVTFQYLFRLRVTLSGGGETAGGGCAAAQGLRPPPAGPVEGALVTWSPGRLEDHGTIACGVECLVTGADGRAGFTFTPETEREPAGRGPERTEQTRVSARVGHVVDFGDPVGSLVLAGSLSPIPVEVSWHRPYRLVLEVDSTITGMDPFKFKAEAYGAVQIPPAPPGDSGPSALSATGMLATETHALKVDGCRGQTTAKGSGFVDFEVNSIQFVDQPRTVLVAVDSGPEMETPDTVRFEGCGAVKAWKKQQSVWEGYFLLSHTDDLAPGKGFLLSGWTWVATDQTWEQGGTIATLVQTEKCRGLCTGKTRFELQAYPEEE